MDRHRVTASQDLEICERVKRLGYAASQRVKLYGEEYEILSDPFLEEGGVALRVKTNDQAEVRILRLPYTILQSVLARSLKRAS